MSKNKREELYNEIIDNNTDEDKKRKKERKENIIFGSIAATLGLCIMTPPAYAVYHNNKAYNFLNKSIESYKEDYEEMSSNENGVKPIDFANYIVSSNNPDLALYAFCSNFQDSPKIIDETIKYIEFDYNESDISDLTYDNFIEINNFRINGSYTSSVAYEIYDDYKHDREIELDNLNVRVKKKSLTLENPDD